jgi:hypothetical protein
MLSSQQLQCRTIARENQAVFRRGGFVGWEGLVGGRGWIAFSQTQGPAGRASTKKGSAMLELRHKTRQAG